MSELPSHHEDHPDVISRNARLGLALFTLYFLLFATFLSLNVFAPETMAQTSFEFNWGERVWTVSFGGPNFDVAYGIGLIFAAILLALLYMRLTRRPDAW